MKYPVITIARYTFLEAVKNRLFILVLIGIICVFGLGQFAGELAVTESREIQGALTGFLLRLAAVFVVGLFVITSMIREFNDKTVDMIIALDLPRHVYFSGKLAGFFALALVLSLLLSLPLLVYADFVQTALWTFSLMCELFIVIALCLLFLFTLGNITTAVSAAAAFYLLARSIGAMQLISRSPILESEAFSQRFMSELVDWIAWLLPQLDRFTQTEWLVYGTGTGGDLIFVGMQTLIYVVLLSAAGLFDLYRKNF